MQMTVHVVMVGRIEAAGRFSDIRSLRVGIKLRRVEALSHPLYPLIGWQVVHGLARRDGTLEFMRCCNQGRHDG